MSPHRGDRSFDDDDLVREEGIFVSRNDTGEPGSGDKDEFAPDDVVEDPVNDEGVPGTVDDLPYDYGVETALPADEMLESFDRPKVAWGPIGRTGADDDGEEPELGKPEERELWRQQRTLIDESGDEAARYRGLREDEVAEVEGAVGEDAAEALSETPEGESATGAGTEPGHGGFPERE
jgi:hypothetical protein